MLEKNSFKKNLAITQGRHLEKINNKIQIFPEKNWTNELKLFKQTKLNYIEWVISADNFDKKDRKSKNLKAVETINNNKVA